MWRLVAVEAQGDCEPLVPTLETVAAAPRWRSSHRGYRWGRGRPAKVSTTRCSPARTTTNFAQNTIEQQKHPLKHRQNLIFELRLVNLSKVERNAR